MSEQSSSTLAAKAPSRSAKFYHDTVIFEIEGILYRVLKHGFVKYSQSFFRDLFDVPQGPGREGDSDDNPIRAPQVTAAEFESLLEVIHPLQFTGYPDLTKEQWTGVLRLSRQWDMPEVATLAIKKMDQLLLTPIEKVQLGKLHGVPRWLKDGYTSLIGNVGSSTLEELKSLGSETAIRILYAQNQAHATIKENTAMYCGQCISNRNGFQSVTRGQTGSYRCTNGWCNTDAMTSSHGAYTKVDFSAPKLASNSSVSEQVTELFKDEIQDAERRETLPPT